MFDSIILIIFDGWQTPEQKMIWQQQAPLDEPKELAVLSFQEKSHHSWMLLCYARELEKIKDFVSYSDFWSKNNIIA